MSRMTPSGGINTEQIESFENNIKMGLIPGATIWALNESQLVVPKIMKNVYRSLLFPLIAKIIFIISIILMVAIIDMSTFSTVVMMVSAVLSLISFVLLVIISWGMLVRTTSSIHIMMSMSYIEKSVVSQLIELAEEKNVDVNDLETIAQLSFDSYMNKVESLAKEPTKENVIDMSEEQKSYHDKLTDIQSLLILRQMQAEYREDSTGTGQQIEDLINDGVSDEDIKSHIYMKNGLDVNDETVSSIRALMMRIDMLTDIVSLWSNKEDIVSLKYDPPKETRNEWNT